MGNSWYAAVVWGVAIGCLSVLIDVAVPSVQIGSQIVFGAGTLVGWVLLVSFSFIYLRSPITGAICGVMLSLSDTVLWNGVIVQVSPELLVYSLFQALLVWVPIHAALGFAGGYFGERRPPQRKIKIKGLSE